MCGVWFRLSVSARSPRRSRRIKIYPRDVIRSSDRGPHQGEPSAGQTGITKEEKRQKNHLNKNLNFQNLFLIVFLVLFFIKKSKEFFI